MFRAKTVPKLRRYLLYRNSHKGVGSGTAAVRYTHHSVKYGSAAKEVSDKVSIYLRIHFKSFPIEHK